MKYMGSKNRLAKDLAPIIQSYITSETKGYLEPFVGGANMIDKINHHNKIGCDINEYLIAMWKAIQDGYKPPKDITKDEYDKIRKNKDIYPKELVAIAGFCSTYKGKWFGGYANKSTTKTGVTRNYYDEAVRNILKQKENIQNIEFKCLSYKDIKNINGYVIYCDPPYQGTTKYNFEFNHKEFWDWVREMSKNNIVLCSEYNAPADFVEIYRKEVTIALNKNIRKKNIEKLFIHKSL